MPHNLESAKKSPGGADAAAADAADAGAAGEVAGGAAAVAAAAGVGDGAAGARKVGQCTPTGRSRSGSVQCRCALESSG